MVHLKILRDMEDQSSSNITGLSLLPIEQMVTCKFRAGHRRCASFKEILLKRTQLESLDLEVDYCSDLFDSLLFGIEIPLPPLKTHSLSCNWTGWRQSAAIMDMFDWTKITHLEIQGIWVFDPSLVIPTENLVKLRTLVLAPTLLGESKESAMIARMCNIVTGAVALEKLSLPYDDEDACIAAIIRHGPSLRSLTLRDYTKRHPLSNQNVRALIATCPHLMELSADVEFVRHTIFFLLGNMEI